MARVAAGSDRKISLVILTTNNTHWCRTRQLDWLRLAARMIDLIKGSAAKRLFGNDGGTHRACDRAMASCNIRALPPA